MANAIVVNSLMGSPGSANANTGAAPLAALPNGGVALSSLVSNNSIRVCSYSSSAAGYLDTNSDGGAIILGNVGGRVASVLLKADSAPNIVCGCTAGSKALASPRGTFISGLPKKVNAVIHGLSILSRSNTGLFTARSSKTVTLAVVCDFSRRFFHTTHVTVTGDGSPCGGRTLRLLTRSRRRVHTRCAVLSSRCNSLTDRVRGCGGLLSGVHGRGCVLTALSGPPDAGWKTVKVKSFSVRSVNSSTFLRRVLVTMSVVANAKSFRGVIDVNLLLKILVVYVRSIFRNTGRVGLRRILMN